MRRSARMFIAVAIMIAMLLVLPDAAQGQPAIAKSGRTTVTRIFETKAVKVSIDTIRLNNGSGAFPKEEWLAGIKAVTLIQRLEISLDGESVFIPRSVFADLLNPGRASVEFSNRNFVLSITGADSAESYFMRVYFDTAKVKRRMLYSALTPDKPAEDTQYRLTVLKDE
jgi:hypothetical protein